MMIDVLTASTLDCPPRSGFVVYLVNDYMILKLTDYLDQNIELCHVG